MGKKYILPFVILIFNTIYSQNISDKNFEVSGTINYSYTKNIFDIAESEIFQRYNVQHIIDVQPTIGYFLFPGIQLSINALYNYQYLKYNLSHYTSNGEIEETNVIVNQMLGVELGPLYNYQLNNSFVIFAGTKFGLKWSFYDSYLGGRSGPQWSKAQITFPIFLAGAKYFLSSDWALLMQLQYKYTSNQSGYSNVNSNYFLFGLGVAVFL